MPAASTSHAAHLLKMTNTCCGVSEHKCLVAGQECPHLWTKWRQRKDNPEAEGLLGRLFPTPLCQSDSSTARQQHHDQGGCADRMTVERDNESRAGVDDGRGKLD